MLESFLVLWVAGSFVMSIDYTMNQKKALENVEMILFDILSKLENSFDDWDYRQVHKFTIEFYQENKFDVFRHWFSSLIFSFVAWPLALLSSLFSSTEHSKAISKQVTFNLVVVYVKALAIFIKSKNIKMKGNPIKDPLENVLSSGTKA